MSTSLRCIYSINMDVSLCVHHYYVWVSVSMYASFRTFIPSTAAFFGQGLGPTLLQIMPRMGMSFYLFESLEEYSSSILSDDNGTSAFPFFLPSHYLKRSVGSLKVLCDLMCLRGFVL